MSNYSTNKIFADSKINTAIDRLHYEIGVALPELVVDDHIELTGRAAAILQGQAVQACKNVILLVNDASAYSFIQNGLPKKLTHKGVVKFKERTIYYLEGLILEIWYVVYPMDKLLAGGVYVQHITKINPIML